MKSKLVKLGLLALSMPLLIGCSFIKDKKANANGIKSIESEVTDEGNVLITITYTDKTMDPVTFVIPKGETGATGIGIASVEHVTDEETGITTITITYTDPEMEKDVFTVQPGKSIDHIDATEDEETHIITMTIYYTDGSLSDPIYIPRGATGETGLGIETIDPFYNVDGSIDITITMTDGTEIPLFVPAPKDGNGIEYIVGSSDSDDYTITIYYTDPNKQPDTITFDRPAQWYTVYEKPSDSYGYEGDYAFDIDHDIIYVKENGTWIIAVLLNTDSASYTVTFDLNASDATRVLGNSSYTIQSGQTFYSAGYQVPYASRPNYTFGGWSTSKTPNVTNGLFTDLTPVLSDMVLYAVWNQ